MSSKPIVYLENNEAWLFDGEQLSPCSFSEAKKYATGTCIALSQLQVGNFKLASSLSEDEREVQIEIKMHDEAGLRADLDYEIASFQHTLEFENAILVEAFAASHEALDACCAQLLKKSKVIDWVVPSFITYSAYYTHNAIEAKTDLFYYLGENEAYAVLFHKGVYTAHRKILSLQELAKEMGIDLQRCRTMLAKNGLDEKAYSVEEIPFLSQLQTLFSKQVEKIVHTINHKRGLFGIEGIDRIYIDFDGQPLKGLEAVFTAYGMEEVSIELLLCHVNENADTHRLMKAMYIYLCANAKMDNALNLSAYERQAPLFKRHSGHLILTGIAASAVALLYPSYFYIQGLYLDDKISILQTQVSAMEAKTQSLGVKLKALKSEVKQNKSKLGDMKSVNKVHQLTIDTLPLLMNQRGIRQKMMYDALELLGKYRLSTVALEQNTTQSMSIDVIADYSSRDRIAKFMKAWMASGYKEAHTKEIHLDEHIYESKIEVLR